MSAIFFPRDRIRHAQSLASDKKSIIGENQIGLTSWRNDLSSESTRAFFITGVESSEGSGSR